MTRTQSILALIKRTLEESADRIDQDNTLRALNLRVTFDEKGNPKAIEV